MGSCWCTMNCVCILLWTSVCKVTHVHAHSLPADAWDVPLLVLEPGSGFEIQRTMVCLDRLPTLLLSQSSRPFPACCPLAFQVPSAARGHERLLLHRRHRRQEQQQPSSPVWFDTIEAWTDTDRHVAAAEHIETKAAAICSGRPVGGLQGSRRGQKALDAIINDHALSQLALS
jgi:hypothetical protein